MKRYFQQNFQLPIRFETSLLLPDNFFDFIIYKLDIGREGDFIWNRKNVELPLYPRFLKITFIKT